MKRLIVLVVIAMMMPSGAFAKSKCAPDIESFCKDTEKSQIGACLDQHQSELSAACQAARESARICADDVKKFCADASKAKEKSACMDKHKDELSPACKASREKQ
jgi:hypothetical protein